MLRSEVRKRSKSYRRPINQLVISNTTPRPPDSRPCFTRMRARPVSCPGKKPGNELAGISKYAAATTIRITPKIVTIAFIRAPNI